MNSKYLPFDIFRMNREKVTDQYTEVIEWLKELGLPAVESRFGKYKKVIDSFNEELKIPSDELSAQNIFHEFLNAHMEVAEIIRIYNSLSNREFNEFAEQLKKVTSGQAFRNISKNDSSRDFAFELTMASRFIQGGFDVQLNQVADIVAVKKGYPKIYIECKRIKSNKRIQENVRKANEQLKKRIASDKSKLCRGIVALNVNELINHENNIAIVESINTLQEYSSKLLDKFIRANVRDLKTKSFNKCIGVIVEMTMQGYTPESNEYFAINCRGAKFLRYSSSDEVLSRNISMLISNQNYA